MSDISPIKKRILQYIEYKNITKYKFYKTTGISNGVLDKNSGLNEENILRIVSVFRDINLIWLMTGSGKMINEYNCDDGNIKGVSEPDNIGYKNNIVGSDEISKLRHLLNEANKDKETYRMLLEEAKLDKEIYRKIAEQNLGLKF